MQVAIAAMVEKVAPFVSNGKAGTDGGGDVVIDRLFCCIKTVGGHH